MVRRTKVEYTRMNREQKGEGIHFDMPHGHQKQGGGKAADKMTDAEVDFALSQPDPPDNGK